MPLVDNILKAIDRRLLESKTRQFDKQFAELPERVQGQARKVYARWKTDPSSTDFRELKTVPGMWRISINYEYRAVAKKIGDDYVWFFIGPHAKYDALWRRGGT